MSNTRRFAGNEFQGGSFTDNSGFDQPRNPGYQTGYDNQDLRGNQAGQGGYGAPGRSARGRTDDLLGYGNNNQGNFDNYSGRGMGSDQFAGNSRFDDNQGSFGYMGNRGTGTGINNSGGNQYGRVQGASERRSSNAGYDDYEYYDNPSVGGGRTQKHQNTGQPQQADHDKGGGLMGVARNIIHEVKGGVGGKEVQDVGKLL